MSGMSKKFNKQKEVRARTSPAPKDTYEDNLILADWILAEMDKAGGAFAYEFAGGRVVTVGIEAMSFHNPIFVGDDIIIYAAAAYLGETSLGVYIEACNRNRHTGKETTVTEGLFTFVALDRNRKPVKIKNRTGKTYPKPPSAKSANAKPARSADAESRPLDKVPARLQPGDISRRVRALPRDTNVSGDIFGGWLLAQMDMACAVRAICATKKQVVTVGLEAMTFHKPVFVGDDVSFYTKVVKTGNTSIGISVESWALRHDSLKYERVTEGTFTFVTVDKDRKPVQVGKIDPKRGHQPS